MSDSRVKDFVNEFVPSANGDLVNVFFWADKEGWGEAKKCDLNSLTIAGAMVDSNTRDYILVTEASFKASTANETRSGIVKTATDAEIEQESGTGVIQANDLSLIREYQGAANTSGVPQLFQHDGKHQSGEFVAVRWTVCFSYYGDGTSTHYFKVNPFPIDNVYIRFAVVKGVARSINGTHFIDTNLDMSSSAKQINMPNGNFYLKFPRLDGDRKPFISISTVGVHSLSVDIWAILGEV